jgi:hypothetical protein
MMRAITQREEQIARLREQMQSLTVAAGPEDFDSGEMERLAIRRLDDLLRSHPEEARGVMEALFDEKLTFTRVETEMGPRY